VLHPPAGLERELVGELGDDLDEIGELLRVALVRLSVESR
jgi:hypothetical protein